MKQYKYNVLFKNGIQTEIWCNGFTECIILAMSEAIRKGNDCRIEKITDYEDVYITEITLPDYKINYKVIGE